MAVAAITRFMSSFLSLFLFVLFLFSDVCGCANAEDGVPATILFTTRPQYSKNHVRLSLMIFAEWLTIFADRGLETGRTAGEAAGTESAKSGRKVARRLNYGNLPRGRGRPRGRLSGGKRPPRKKKRRKCGKCGECGGGRRRASLRDAPRPSIRPSGRRICAVVVLVGGSADAAENRQLREQGEDADERQTSEQV